MLCGIPLLYFGQLHFKFPQRPAHATKASPDPHHTTPRTHTLLTRPPNSLVTTQIQYAHHLPFTNPIPNSSPDQSCLNPNQTDHMYVLKMSSRGFWIGPTSCKSVLINLVLHFTEILANLKSLESLSYCNNI